MRLELPIVWLGGALAALGCESEAARACLNEFGRAQAVVVEVEPEEAPSVEAAVTALDSALAACKKASREGEVEELSKAHAQLTAHRDRLQRRDELRRQRSEISPEELAALAASGDPKCPRGQAYLHKKSNQRIRCTGPQPISMSSERAQEYFKGRGYKTTAVSPTELHFEYGAELTVFMYADAAGGAPPRCVFLYPAPGVSWQEATARLTGTPPARLKPGVAISVPPERLELAVEQTSEKVIARIGDCADRVPSR